MAANPLIACDRATSWYDFTYSLSWSNKCEVAEVISDIPFISVGILVFGVSALFLVMKRVSLSTIWLFFSVSLAFVAAVLDLGQTLADGMVTNTAFIANELVINVREVLFALSIGFRFLFYWTYVTELSRKVLSTVSAQTVQRISFLSLRRTHEHHSGSWVRWELPGKLLGVGLLVAIMTVTALQIVWRVVPQFHQYGSVYGTDAALELIVSFLLLLRLLSNTVTINSSDNMFVHSFREYLAPVSGLLVNIAIGIGDLLCFAFTESAVGRLLQALEVYIIVVFVVVTAFLRHRDTLLFINPSQAKKNRDALFTLPKPARRSTFRITPPFIETPRMSTVLGTATQNKESGREMLYLSARCSLNHVSSWISSKVSRSRACCEDEEVRLWSAEKLKVDAPHTGSVDTEPAHSAVSLTQEPKNLQELLRDASVNHLSIISESDVQSAIIQSMEGSIHGGQISHPSRVDVLPQTTPLQVRTSPVPVSLVPSSVFSGVKHASCMAATLEASPVYSLSGIQSFASASDSSTSLNEALRQKNQLDQGLEAIKSFSARTSAASSHSHSTTSPRSMKLTRSRSTGQRTVSSEISLSNFPVPSWLTSPVPSLPPFHPSFMRRMRGNRRACFAAARPTPVQDTHASFPSITSMSLVDIPSSPCFNSTPCTPLGEENGSPSAEAGKSSRSDSGLTQYNVTSFIGGLATPGESRQGSQEKCGWPTENESNVEGIEATSGVKELPLSMLPVPRWPEGLQASPIVAMPSHIVHPSRIPQGDVATEPVKVMQYRTNNQASCAQPVVLSPYFSVMDHPEKGVTTPPTNSQLIQETKSCKIISAEKGQVQQMFVRPRPPPLVIQSYAEQRPGISQVQVVVED